MAWSYTLREYSGMMTSFLRPVRFGSRCMRSGLAPAMRGRGAVSQRGAAAGGDDSPLRAGEFGQPLTDAVHQFVHLHEVREASSMACFTSGRVCEPVMMVNVPVH